MRKAFKNIIRFLLISGLAYCCLILPALAQVEADLTAAIERTKAAGVSDKIVNHLLVLGYKHNIQAKEMAGLVNTIAQAAEEKLPAAPLADKIEEGLAKRIRPEVIQRVLDKELSQYRFTRQVLIKALNRWGKPITELKPGTLTRLGQTLSAGITKQELEGFLARTPKAPMHEILNAAEFMAALKQSELRGIVAEDIVLTGLKNNFFSNPDWILVRMTVVAKRKGISDKDIRTAAMRVVKGSETVQEAARSLGLSMNGMRYGPVVRGGGTKTGGGISGGTGGSGGHGSGLGGGEGGRR
ncbi:MAG: hypothetical protein JRI34_05280 [Deltaproteobacteria bacterium]|nr:hypothetical protein [Deltaproteobacteria bacterium]